MFSEIVSMIAAVGGLVGAFKAIPEIQDRRRRKRLGQKLVQVQMQLNQVLESGFDIIDSIESIIARAEGRPVTDELIMKLSQQEKRIRTSIAIFLDPDTRILLEMLDPNLRREVANDLSEKRLHILTDLDRFVRSECGYYQHELGQLYNPERLQESKDRLLRLQRESESLSRLIKEEFSLEELI